MAKRCRLRWAPNYGQPMPAPKPKPKPQVPNAVQVARAQVNAAFAKGTVPAPYYLFVLLRAQHARMPLALANGCAGNAAGTVVVQRFTAQHKGPTATRRAWATQLVPCKPRHYNIAGAKRTVYGHTVVVVQKQVTVVP